MSNLSDLGPFLASCASVQRGTVLGFTNEGLIRVELQPCQRLVTCQMLNSESAAPLSMGDTALVWFAGSLSEEPCLGVVLGRIGARVEPSSPVVDASRFASWPESITIEAQGDVILRNGQAKIKLGAQGDIEIVCSNFVTRSQRLLRLLAPLIKLN